MDKYITIEIYTNNYLHLINMPVRISVYRTIRSIVDFIHESFNDNELSVISFIGEDESITLLKKDIIKILINGKGVM